MKSPAAARLTDLQDATLGLSDVSDDALVTGLAVSGAFLEVASTEFVEMTACQFTGGSLADSQWYRTRWVDVAFTEVDLANASLTESGLERVSFDGCRMTGFQTPVGRLTDVTFTRCTLTAANLRAAALRRVQFVDCTLIGSQWADASFEQVGFARCDLSEARFVGPGRIAGLRFDEVSFDRATGLTALRGATIAGADLPALAVQLGHEVGLTVEFASPSLQSCTSSF